MSEPLSGSLVESEPKWPLAIAGASIATGATALLPGCYFLIKFVVQTWTLFQPLRELSGHWFGFWTSMLSDMAPLALLLLLNCLLLWAGLRCWKRQRYAAGMHIIWALIRIGSVCAGLSFVYYYYLASGSPDFPGAGGKNGFPLSSAIIMVLSLAYPFFVLVWFLRKKVRRAVAEWRTRHRNQLDYCQLTSWPYTIAGASVALGSCALLGQCYFVTHLAATTGPDKMMLLAGNILWAALYGLLLWAGVACWKHKRRTVGMHIGFAIGCIAMSLGSPFLIPETWHVNILNLVWGAGVAALGLTYQVFLLVWFTRSKVRQTIAGWDEPTATAGGNLASP